jgi:hypothetical protein
LVLRLAVEAESWLAVKLREYLNLLPTDALGLFKCLDGCFLARKAGSKGGELFAALLKLGLSIYPVQEAIPPASDSLLDTAYLYYVNTNMLAHNAVS